MSSEPTSIRILITGAAGFIGKKLTARLVKDGTIRSKGNDLTISELVLTDVVEPESPKESPFSVRTLKADLSVSEDATALVADKPDVIFHLAAIVSGDAEKNFEKGYLINMDGTRSLLEAIRAVGSYTPRLVFASSAAVFGSPVPDPIPDSFHLTPRTSYGTQKAVCELLIDDYSRKGFLDGVSIRFPTIAIRPGKPNKAASSFISGIIREPLSGVEAVCPVDRDIRHPIASPRRAVEFLMHAASLDSALLVDGRAITMPSITVSVGEMIDALERTAGKEVVALIKMEKDDFVQGIISNWQFRFDAKRALELGFKPDECFADIVKAHIDDELGGAVHAAKKQHVAE